MNLRSGKRAGRSSATSRILMSAFVAVITMVTGTVTAQVEVAQAPLYVGSRVPGNLALVPSVEYPTIISQANIGDYVVARSYMGYFDAAKCYEYVYDNDETKRHFKPVSTTETHRCSNGQWSGNYMNWAATQTIDPFRLALTGGYRVVDEVGKTWLEKARHDRAQLYPDRTLSSDVSGSTPAGNWGSVIIRIQGLGNRMRFAAKSSDLGGSSPVAYNPSRHELVNTNWGGPKVRDTRTDQYLDSTLLEVSVRVAVCVSGLLEKNCKAYQGGWKPEGLIQEYSDRIRYSIFGYLNDSYGGDKTSYPNGRRDGGVLRAQQKFVGPFSYDPTKGAVANTAAREWDPVTGVLYRNPDAADATATNANILDSGVINYLNKFGQMTDWNHKSYDPVSELYYTAVRYFKKLGNVASYTSLSGSDAYKYADGFPVISAWNDPVQFRCQANVILGIGDVYTHADKNLPGNKTSTAEPDVPAEVSADQTVDVVKALNKIAELEGITLGTPFTGRNNSAYIAALAYDSHTRDIRQDVAGRQTIATHWVDVRENQRLEPKTANQYWLAAKYGGFRVPDGFDPYARTEALDPAWWHGTADYLTSGPQGGTTTTVTDYPRPDNFYVASEADKMIESLTKAFQKIADEMSGSSSSLASNTTRLEAGAMAYQSRFYSPSWRGELSAYALDPDTGHFSDEPVWNAGDKLPAWAQRKIYVHNPESNKSPYQLLTWNALGPAQQAVLGSAEVVNYLRGDRSNEGKYRVRQGVLGDIVHSQPVFVGQPDVRLYYGAGFEGAGAYVQFAQDQAQRVGVVYVGANDGMLHAFNAETGVEVYAFMPAAAINADLKSLSSPDYEHRFFVDGEITVADVYSKADKEWKTILVGSMGRGGKAVFALDITDPADVKFLWEKSATDIPELGNTLGKPIIAQVANGDWRVLIGNGPNSAAETAQLVMIGVESGVATVRTTGVSGNNGLSAVDAWDTDRDGFYDTVYGGDLLGNMWRFTGAGGGSAVTSKLFTAIGPDSNVQPITAAPLVMMNPDTRAVWVYFGTGRYLGDGDVSNKEVQSWYGLIDDGNAVTGRSSLANPKILLEVPDEEDTTLIQRVTSKMTGADLAGKDGWYIDLVSPAGDKKGERMVIPNRFERGMLIGTTRIPNSTDACSPGGTGFVMAVDPFTGSRPASTFFDVNGDGKFDEKDMVKVGDEWVPATGLGFGSSPNGPIFVDDDMLVNLDDGTKKKLDTRGTGSKASRISWRELLMD